MTTQKEAIAKAPERRVRRTPIGQRNVLTLSGKEPGYVYRFVNDVGDRIQEFIDNGYEVVKGSKVSIGDKRLGTASAEGSAAQAAVGQGTKAIAMRIREDWYQEDQAAKQAYVKQTEDAMKGEALDGTYGKLDLNARE